MSKPNQPTFGPEARQRMIAEYEQRAMLNLSRAWDAANDTVKERFKTMVVAKWKRPRYKNS